MSLIRRLGRNTPVPEIHLTFLAMGLLLQIIRPRRAFSAGRLHRILGWPALLLGIAGVAWATWATRDVDISRPNRIISGGPYALSRNPMYVAWTVLYAGVALIVNSLWLSASLPLVVVITDLYPVRREEHALEEAFAAEYRAYRAKVRRWV